MFFDCASVSYLCGERYEQPQLSVQDCRGWYYCAGHEGAL